MTPFDSFKRQFQELVKALEAGGYHAVVPRPPASPDKYPHRCPKCKGPAYVGFTDVDCWNRCK